MRPFCMGPCCSPEDPDDPGLPTGCIEVVDPILPKPPKFFWPTLPQTRAKPGPKPRPEIQERRDKVSRLFKLGRTQSQIAAALNATRSQVENDLEKLGLTTPKEKKE